METVRDPSLDNSGTCHVNNNKLFVWHRISDAYKNNHGTYAHASGGIENTAATYETSDIILYHSLFTYLFANREVINKTRDTLLRHTIYFYQIIFCSVIKKKMDNCGIKLEKLCSYNLVFIQVIFVQVMVVNCVNIWAGCAGRTLAGVQHLVLCFVINFFIGSFVTFSCRHDEL